MSESELALEMPYGRAAASATASASAAVSSPVAVARQAASQHNRSQHRMSSPFSGILHAKTASLPFTSPAPLTPPAALPTAGSLAPPQALSLARSRPSSLAPSPQPTLGAQTPSPMAPAADTQVGSACGPTSAQSGTCAAFTCATLPPQKEKEKAPQKGGQRAEQQQQQQAQSQAAQQSQPSKNNFKAKLIKLVRRFKPPSDSVEALDPATASSHAGRNARPRCALLHSLQYLFIVDVNFDELSRVRFTCAGQYQFQLNLRLYRILRY